MGIVLTLAVSAYFFIISYRLQFSYFLLVFLIPFLPKYIGFGLGSEGFSLSLMRILLMILFMSFIVSFTQNGEYISKRILFVYRQNKILINLLLLFFVLKVVSLSLNSREISLYIMIVNDFLFTAFLFILTILLIDSEESIHRLAKILFYGYTIVLILVLIESFLKYPLLSMFASAQMNLGGLEKSLSEGFLRGGRYRSSGSFINPIVLGNYLIILLPVVVAYIYRNSNSLTFKIAYFLLVIYAIYSTGSRSAILMTIVMVYLYLIFTLYRSDQFSRFLAKTFNLIVVGIVSYFTYSYVHNLIINFHGRFDNLGGAETISSTSRALQYVAIFDKMQEAPFFGFGKERNFVTEFSFIAIDNYYFWVILEVGVVGLFVYFLFLYILVKTALQQYKQFYKSYYLLPLLLSILLSIFYMVLSSAPDILTYLYIFAGLICVMKVFFNKKQSII